MKKYLILIIFITLNSSLLTLNSYSQWVQQSVPVTGGSFNDMKFVNANSGFIINWNYPVATLLRTTNAGYNWQTLNNWGMAHIAIVDTNCIYTSGQNNSLGKLYKSTNLGITWDSMLTTTDYYSYLHFFNKDTGLISGGDSFDNFIWRTTNGGQSLQLIATYGGASPGKFHFLKEKVNGEYYGWMYYSGGINYRTTNSGLSWTEMPLIPTFVGLKGFCYINKDTAFATINNTVNYILYTTNGGTNWNEKYLSYTSSWYDIFFINSLTGWIGVGLSNKIYATTNGGSNWGTQFINGSAASSSIYFIDSNVGWIRSSFNTVAHTTNGGGPITRIVNNSKSLASYYTLHQNYPNPFNPSTTISCKLAKSGNIRIKVFDISGKEIEELVNKDYKQGLIILHSMQQNIQAEYISIR